MQSRKVFIVDDQDSFRRTIKDVLSMLGNVEIIGEAASGAEYLKAIENITPEVTFMDIQMPGLNGIETTKKALQKKPGLVIIGLSLYANDEYVDELLKAGAKGYMLKLSNNYNLFKSIIENPKSEMFFSERIKKQLDERNNAEEKTVLVVDDFEINTVVVENSLKSAGYKVIKAKNADHAVKIAFDEKQKFDLIITDYNLQGKNGVQMFSDIKKVPGYSRVQAIILSNDDDETKKKIARESGVSGWLNKPFIISKFLNIVESVL